MNTTQFLKTICLSLLVLVTLSGCFSPADPIMTHHPTEAVLPFELEKIEVKEPVVPKHYYVVKDSVTTGDYYDFIDEVVAELNDTLSYNISEHLLVRANLWLIDSFANTDYYHLMEKGIFVYDPTSIVILEKGDSLLIPNEADAKILQEKMANTIIDVNIPEFKLQIMEGENLIHECDVRVGKDTRRYLAMAGRTVDLRTKPGEGEIVRINREAKFINPRDNKRYSTTSRDDGKRTKLPNIPWLEPEINGQRHGQLIHPTTNITTLGKAYSNGCIGTSEADAWRVYFYAPLGTKVRFRYDLETINEMGDTVIHKDIYPGFVKPKKNIQA